jgi:hypothetical protein
MSDITSASYSDQYTDIDMKENYLIKANLKEHVDVIVDRRIIKDWIYADRENGIVVAKDKHGKPFLLYGDIRYRKNKRCCKFSMSQKLLLDILGTTLGITQSALEDIQITGVELRDNILSNRKTNPSPAEDDIVLSFIMKADWLPFNEEGEAPKELDISQINSMFLEASGSNHTTDSFQV